MVAKDIPMVIIITDMYFDNGYLREGDLNIIYQWNAMHCWRAGVCARKIRSTYNITVCAVPVTCK